MIRRRNVCSILVREGVYYYSEKVAHRSYFTYGAIHLVTTTFGQWLCSGKTMNEIFFWILYALKFTNYSQTYFLMSVCILQINVLWSEYWPLSFVAQLSTPPSGNSHHLTNMVQLIMSHCNSTCHCNTFEQTVSGCITLVLLQIISQNIHRHHVNIFPTRR